MSPSSYRRWPPCVRRGFGNSKRRSQLRSVCGLTPSMAAAAFVLIVLMGNVMEVCGALSKQCNGTCACHVARTRCGAPEQEERLSRRRRRARRARPAAGRRGRRVPSSARRTCSRGARRRWATGASPRAAQAISETRFGPESTSTSAGTRNSLTWKLTTWVSWTSSRRSAARETPQIDERGVDDQERVARRRRDVGGAPRAARPSPQRSHTRAADGSLRRAAAVAAEGPVRACCKVVGVFRAPPR